MCQRCFRDSEMDQNAWQIHQRCAGDAPKMLLRLNETHLRCTRDAPKTRKRCHVSNMHQTCTWHAAEMHLRCISRGIRDALLREIRWISICDHERCNWDVPGDALHIPLMKRWDWDAFEVIRNCASRCNRDSHEMQQRFIWDAADTHLRCSLDRDAPSMETQLTIEAHKKCVQMI